VFLPLLFILLAAAPAFVVAYGTDPRWMQYQHGFELILFSRKFQWPLVSLSLIACVGLLALIVSGRKRAWWLIGLAPVLALFGHRFAVMPEVGAMTTVENPTFVPAAHASFVHDDDYVVGLHFGDTYYAYPYAQLYQTPVVVQADHEKRLMLIWSAYANRALAITIHRDLHARDLDIVSTPANALLLYNTRLGQFINGLTGMTVKGEKPAGFGSEISALKMPWSQWRQLHADTSVLAPISNTHAPVLAPTKPLTATCPMPPMILEHPFDMRVALVGDVDPIAIESSEIGSAPLNLKLNSLPVLVFRDESSHTVRAYSRQLKPDVLPQFVRNTNPRKHPNATFVDVDTASGWNADGVWVDGDKDFKGKKLDHVLIEDGLSWGVLKYWYPQLNLEKPPQHEQELQEPDEQPAKPAPVRTGRRSRRRGARPSSR